MTRTAAPDRPLGRRLVRLADDDDWSACRRILLLAADDDDKADSDNAIDERRQCPHQRRPWLGATTPGGDGLVHLSSFASCDAVDLSLDERRDAFRCLRVVLDEDPFAATRIAGDGGTALHCAVVAASSFFSAPADDADGSEASEGGECDENDSEGDDGGGGDDDDDERDGEKGSGLVLNSFPPPNDDLVSTLGDDLTILALSTLLDAGADPNVPLIARSASMSSSSIDDGYGNEDSEEDNEPELAYSREAARGRWTPLALALEWAVLASSATSSSSYPSGRNDFTTKDEERREEDPLDTPLKAIRLLLQSGADPSYHLGMVGGCDDGVDGDRAARQWNGHEFVAGCAGVLSQRRCFSQEERKDEGASLSTSSHSMLDRIQCMFDEFDTSSSSLKEGGGKERRALSSVQLFASAALANDVEGMRDAICKAIIKDNENDNATEEARVVAEWRSACLGDVLPAPSAAWSKCGGAAKAEKWTLLSAAASCGSIDAVRYLVERRGMRRGDERDKGMSAVLLQLPPLSEEEATAAVAAVLSSSLALVSPSPSTTACARVRQEEICSTLVDAASRVDDEDSKTQQNTSGVKGGSQAFDGRRQRLFDRLLLRSCSYPSSWGLPDGVRTLLRVGADPDASSAIDAVAGRHRPLHLVASHCRNLCGVNAAAALISCGADVVARNDDGDAPLSVALQRGNHHLAETLWDAMELRCSSGGNRHGRPSPPLAPVEARQLGEAAVERGNIRMLQDSVARIVDNVSKGARDRVIGDSTSVSVVLSDDLGALLLRMVDPRSGVGTSCQMEGDSGIPLLKEMLDIIATDLTSSGNGVDASPLVIPTFALDNVSKQSPLHFLLREDRGETLRRVLIDRLCEVAIANDRAMASTCTIGDDIMSSKASGRISHMISLPCDVAFGGYTALHLACALGCEGSIDSLVKHGADVEAMDSEGLTPKQRIPMSVSFVNKSKLLEPF